MTEPNQNSTELYTGEALCPKCHQVVIVTSGVVPYHDIGGGMRALCDYSQRVAEFEPSSSGDQRHQLWECECPLGYIHSVTEKYCEACGKTKPNDRN